MITHCATCGALVFRERRGRPRQYCSDACRYAMIAARRPPVTKPTACAQCGAPIEQPRTGRPRQYCVPCVAGIVQQKPARKATALSARS